MLKNEIEIENKKHKLKKTKNVKKTLFFKWIMLCEDSQ